MLGKELEEEKEKRGREEKTRNCGEQEDGGGRKSKGLWKKKGEDKRGDGER